MKILKIRRGTGVKRIKYFRVTIVKNVVMKARIMKKSVGLFDDGLRIFDFLILTTSPGSIHSI